MKNISNIKLILLFIASVALITLIFGVNISLTKDKMEKAKAEYVNSAMGSMSNTIDSWFEANINIVETIANDFKVVNNKDEIQQLLHMHLESTPETSVMYVGFEDDEHISTREVDPNFKPSERPWYTAAINEPSQNVVVNTPYVDYVTQELVITFSKSLGKIEGKMAVIGCDVFARDFVDMIENIYLSKVGYFFIVDNYGNIVYHPNSEFEPSSGKSVSVNDVPEYQFLFQSDDTTEIVLQEDYDGSVKYFVPKTIPSVDWQVVGVVSPSKIMESYGDYLNVILPSYLLVIGALAVVLLVIAGSNKLRELKDQLLLNEKLVDIAISNSGTFIFEYKIREKTITSSNSMVEELGARRVVEEVPGHLFHGDVVLKEDGKVISEALECIDRGHKHVKFNIKLKDKKKIEHWHSVALTNVFDEKGHPYRAIGVIKNIDDEVTFKNLSEIDQMTGLLNKEDGIKKIKNLLDASNPNKYHALYIVDLDFFKEINDNFGHSFGDQVIINAANSLKSVFTEVDIVCRFGGDEFIVFASNVEPEYVAISGEKICETLRREYESRDHTVTASVGVSITSGNDKTYTELFNEADLALYASKEAGRNISTLFKKQSM